MTKMNPLNRSQIMARVRGKDTKPEMVVRRMLHGRGYRYRLHCSKLPGSPDLVFPARRKVIFVHGCFWHRHDDCKMATMPKTATEFWRKKFKDNVRRDQRNLQALKNEGWTAKVVWECETLCEDLTTLEERLIEFLGE